MCQPQPLKMTLGVEMEMTYVFDLAAIRKFEEEHQMENRATRAYMYVGEVISQQIPESTRSLPNWVRTKVVKGAGDYKTWNVSGDSSIEHENEDLYHYFKGNILSSSCQNVEIISPPFKYEEAEPSSDLLLTLLQTPEYVLALAQVERTLTWQDGVGGAFANDSTGLHLHLNLPDFAEPPLEIMKAFFLIWAVSEPFIEQMHPVHRRGYNNWWARSLRERTRYLSNQALANMVYETQNVEELSAIFEPMEDFEKYTKVWISGDRPPIKPWTIEFREHRGTINAEEITWWIRFCAKVMQLSNAIAQENYRIVGSEIQNLQGLFTVIKMDPQGVKYYTRKVAEYRGDSAL